MKWKDQDEARGESENGTAGSGHGAGVFEGSVPQKPGLDVGWKGA